MNKLKKFLEKKKVDKKFKQAGQGYSLSGGASSANSGAASTSPKHGYKPPEDTVDRRQISASVAEAATRRLQPEPSLSAAQRRIREQARKELEEEQRLQAARESKAPSSDERDRVRDFDHSDQISSLFYTCDLFESTKVLPKKEMIEAVETYLRGMLNEEPAEASIIMFWSLNSQEKIDQALPILLKYLSNIVSSPEEAKYRRIRTSNKIFKEKIAGIKGGVEFLKSVGFMEDDQRNDDGSVDTFLALPEPDENSLELLESAALSLDNGARISLKLYRDPKVYRIDPSKPVPKPEVPQDFFTLTGEELRKEQQQRTENLDKLTTLRTSKMREADAKLRQYNYKYTLIRIRFPNCFVLQGVFSVHESFGMIREFVEEKLATVLGEFTITDPITKQRFENDEKSLYDYGLAPAAVVYFDWDNSTLRSLAQSGHHPVYLHPEVESKAEAL